MKANFVSHEDAIRKLSGSYVFYAGIPVYVSHDANMLEQDQLNLVKINGCKDVIKPKVHMNDPEFELGSATLGYVNHDGTAYYMTRIPVRRNVQGLSVDNISCNPGWEGPRFYNSQGFYQMLVNKYPSATQAIARLDGSGTSMAFHRYFAVEELQMHVYLKHRGETIGTYDKKKNQFVLLSSDATSFLAQIMKREKFDIGVV